jgi:hypothetical protein
MFLFDDDRVADLDSEDLAEAKPEKQKETMKAWFLTHYDDPVNVCPYESREDGYQYIWGGPYVAQEELSNEFGGIVDDDMIDECAQELENEHGCYDWSGNPDQDQPDDYLAEVIETSQFYETFGNNLDRIRQLLEVELPSTLKQYFLRLLYAGVVTTLEAYLSDAFIVTVFADNNLLCKLVTTDRNLKAKKVELTDLLSGDTTPEKVVREYLRQISWHNLAKVHVLYKTVLGVRWPDKLGDLYEAVRIRHDIVHRNGKTPDGDERSLSRENVEAVVVAAKDLVNAIDKKVRQLSPNHESPTEVPYHESPTEVPF